MVAAIYGGLAAGLFATGLACLTVIFSWSLIVSEPFIRIPADWLGVAVFVFTGTMISGVSEAMRRANMRAKRAQEQAEAANLAKSVFLANMSHELRTPLNAILGFAGILRNDAGISGEQRKTLAIIHRSGEHLLSLINDVLDMAKVEAGRISVENAPFDLGEMVRDITGLMHGRAEEKNLQLVLDQSSDFPLFVQADDTKLRQALINLVGNAIKYTERGTVTLRLGSRPMDRPGRLLLIVEVEDTGIGIAAGDRERIFDPFVQVDRRTVRKGTGLGLAISRKNVETMGGRISVDSTLGKGSIFRVEVPVDRIDDLKKDAIRIDPGRIVGLAPGQPGYRLLIVEDQEENWLLLKRMLEDAGFHVNVAGNGAEGIEVFRTWRPHFIWMDVRMPVMDGLEATRRIREMEGGRDVKIAALTASVFKEERDNVLAAGMDDFIRKPYRPEEIFDCLTRHLGVRFLHEESTAAGDTEPAGALGPDTFTGLPEGLRGELADALVSLDAPRIAGTVIRVSERNPALGAVLARHVEQLNYTEILRSLRTGGITPYEESR